jgi:regulation of enolase protein 1 (concanavalin A-like superfamily)
MQWLNEAPEWSHDGDTISITAAPKTDFWRITHDGGQRDSGHFYGEEASGDFIAEVRFSAEYAALYDQAGLMVRLDEKNWMKCGIELFNGVQHASAVVTREFSDWSIVPLDPAPSALWMRVKRAGNALEVSYSLDGATYTMLRQSYFPPQVSVLAGVMVCAPTGDGFTATFEGLRIRPLG